MSDLTISGMNLGRGPRFAFGCNRRRRHEVARRRIGADEGFWRELVEPQSPRGGVLEPARLYGDNVLWRPPRPRNAPDPARTSPAPSGRSRADIRGGAGSLQDESWRLPKPRESALQDWPKAACAVRTFQWPAFHSRDTAWSWQRGRRDWQWAVRFFSANW